MSGRQILMRNTLVALCFAVPAVFLLPTNGNIPAVIFAIVWALFFEYGYHRWLQHRPGTVFADKHRQHHGTYRQWNEENHLNFGGHPIFIITLFGLNGVFLAVLDFVFRINWLPAAMLTFVAYFITMEIAHRRIHLNLWMPFGLGVRHHHGHHMYPPRNFSVFIPLMDCIFGTRREKSTIPNPKGRDSGPKNSS
jgi:hypothetical protein